MKQSNFLLSTVSSVEQLRQKFKKIWYCFILVFEKPWISGFVNLCKWIKVNDRFSLHLFCKLFESISIVEKNLNTKLSKNKIIQKLINFSSSQVQWDRSKHNNWNLMATPMTFWFLRNILQRWSQKLKMICARIGFQKYTTLV